MKAKIRFILAALGLVVLAGLPVFAQSIPMRVNIPFRFLAGDTELGAGRYTVRMLANGPVFQIQNTDGRQTVNVFHIGSPSNGTSERGQLVFHRYGSDYFLSKIDWPDYGPAVELRKSARESELARLAAAQPVSVSRSDRR